MFYNNEKTLPLLTQSSFYSFSEFRRISFPLLFSLLSNSLMLFFDRYFITKHSINSLNAIVHAGAIITIFQLSLVSIASSSEVFIGKYYGENLPLNIGKVVWQMIWFSLAAFTLSLPLAFFADSWFFHNGMSFSSEIVYFRWVMSFVPLFSLVVVFSVFYTGRKSMGIPITASIGANLLNVFLDWYFIFGRNPSLGIQGAALATIISQSIYVLILATPFFKKKIVITLELGITNFVKTY